MSKRRSIGRNILIVVPVVIAASTAGAAGDVRWRVPGTACRPFDNLYTYYHDFGDLALPDDDASGNNSQTIANCFIPTGTNLVELHDTNSRLFKSVSMRYELQGAGNEPVVSTLMAQDYDSHDFCTCDEDNRVGGGGPFNVVLTRDGDTSGPESCDTNCTGGSVPTNWSLSVEVRMGDSIGGSANTLVIKTLTVYDT